MKRRKIFVQSEIDREKRDSNTQSRTFPTRSNIGTSESHTSDHSQNKDSSPKYSQHSGNSIFDTILNVIGTALFLAPIIFVILLLSAIILWIVSMMHPPAKIILDSIFDPLWIYLTELIVASRNSSQ